MMTLVTAIKICDLKNNTYLWLQLVVETTAEKNNVPNTAIVKI